MTIGGAVVSSGGSLLSVFLDLLPVDGGSITVISRSGLSSTVATSDPLAASLDALQTDLGEGPRWLARLTGSPVLVTDLAGKRAGAEWPLFVAAITGSHVGGVFAFPLLVGVLVVGVVDLYSHSADGAWTTRQIDDARGVAASAGMPAVRLASRSAAASQSTAGTGTAELRREVHQATGVLVALLQVPPDEALALLQAYAFGVDQPLLDVSRDVVGKRLDVTTVFG